MPEAATKHGTLTPDEVETVVIDNHDGAVEIVNRSGTGTIWARFDGVDPVAAAAGTYVVLGGRRFENLSALDTGALTVKLLSTAALDYSVEGAL
jgi:hypothetical protein